MTDFSTRFRLIYVPFLWIDLLFITIYSFFHWIFVIELGLPLNEELVHFWLPFTLPWIPIFIWLGPRIKLLILKDKKGNLPFLYRFIAGFAIAIPALIAQDYVETATGRLTVLNDISALNTQSLTKYYELKKHIIDKQHFALYKRVEITGRYSENYEMFIDVACPILPDSLKPGGEVNIGTPLAWLGIEFKRKISNHLDEYKKDDEWKDFDTVTSADFKAKNLDGFVYLDRIGTNARHKAYIKAIGNITQNESLAPIIFEGVNTPFKERNGQKLPWTAGSFLIGAAVWFLMILFPKINRPEVKKAEESTVRSQWEAFFNPLIHFKLPDSIKATAVLIGLNALVFLIMVFAGLGVISFDARDLLSWGADYRPATTNGEWWRLLTSIFLHGGLMHIISNMTGLAFAGLILEPLIESTKYTWAYLVCGLVSSLTSICWHPATISVGASGAIFGLYGVLTALLTTSKADFKSKRPLLIFSLFFIVFNLLVGLTGGVDNAAHIGGLLSGLMIGYLLYFSNAIPDPVKPTKRRKKVKPAGDTDKTSEVGQPKG